MGVIIPAAGSSSRFGGSSKMDADLGGRPVLHRTVDLFAKRDDVDAIVVAGPYEESAWGEFRLRHGDTLGLLGVTLCRGGETTRTQTVRASLEQMPEDCTHIAVHDGARPATPIELIDRVFKAAQTHEAVIPAIEVGDTLKRVDADVQEEKEIDPLDAILGGGGKQNVKVRTVQETVSREGLVLVQTPHVFEAEVLRRAYAGDTEGTDDAALVEAIGVDVVVVEGDPRNVKITQKDDVDLAMRIMGLRASRGRESHKRF
ncbi:MAG: 2-C-methyl-D-erythritol 4-phosphate cytidylyltransferase [Phycisphaerales bacterium JB043]